MSQPAEPNSDSGPDSEDKHSDIDSDREERFDELCADILDAADSGEQLDESAIIADHPDLADSLRKFFLDHKRMAGALRSDDETASEKELDPNADPNATFSLNYSTVPSVSARPVAPSQRIDDYEIIDEIAHGGMGVVYKAKQISLDRIVALKMIRSGELADKEEIERFRREAQAAAQLQHPGIVPIYEIGSETGQHFFSMAFIEGQSLAAKIKEQALSPRVAAEYTMKVARATHYAHEQGIVHRDIKPANVLLDTNNEPLVTDFGLAKQIRADHELTMSGQILGTASYMSPEQARGDQSLIGPQSDVYSLGALLYTLLTQQPPFTGDNPLDILLDVLSKDPDAPSNSNLGLSRDIETICLKCLEKKPAKRYASAAALADDLERFLEHKPIVARPITRIERGLRWCRRKPAFATAITMAFCLAIGLPTANYLGWDMTKIFSEQSRTAPTMLLETTARTHYATGSGKTYLDADKSEGRDRLYVLAAKAMLAFDDSRKSEASRPLFEQTENAITAELEADPNNDELRFALSDCLMTLTTYKSLELSKRVEYLDRARDLLETLGKQHPNNMQITNRIAFAASESLETSTSTTDDSVLRAQGKAARAALVAGGPIATNPDVSRGIIRFSFSPLQEAVPASSPIHAANQLRIADDQDALEEYRRFIYSRSDGDELSSDETRTLFCDLALLFEGTMEKTLPRSIWPTTPEGIYNAVLGMRLTATDLVDRSSQLRP